MYFAPFWEVKRIFGTYESISPDAQQIWERYVGHTSAFVPGTRAYKYAQGKQVLFMTQDQAKLVEKLTTLYAKAVGFK